MRVNVFVSEVMQNGEPTALLALPASPEAAVPAHLQNVEWRYFATVDAGDAVIGLPVDGVEAALVADGYVVTTPRLRGG